MTIAADLSSLGFATVLETALDAVVVMRSDGTVAGWNGVAERTFGWSFDEAVNRRMSELIIPERYRSAHETGLAHFLATGEGPVLNRHIEIEGVHRDGHVLPIELSISATRQGEQSVFLGFIRDITERRDHERRQTLMVAELNHRAKNLLGVVSAIAHHTVRASTNLEDFSPAFTGRLQSLGRAHEILTAATWEQASLLDLAKALLEGFIDDAQRVTIDGPDILLSPRHFLSISMILHELTTNAVKYGALSASGGKVRLRWYAEGHQVRLNWREKIAGKIVPPTRSGFGSKMISLNVRHDLRSHAEHVWHDDGLEFSLLFDRAHD